MKPHGPPEVLCFQHGTEEPVSRHSRKGFFVSLKAVFKQIFDVSDAEKEEWKEAYRDLSGLR